MQKMPLFTVARNLLAHFGSQCAPVRNDSSTDLPLVMYYRLISANAIVTSPRPGRAHFEDIGRKPW